MGRIMTPCLEFSGSTQVRSRSKQQQQKLQQKRQLQMKILLNKLQVEIVMNNCKHWLSIIRNNLRSDHDSINQLTELIVSNPYLPLPTLPTLNSNNKAHLFIQKKK